MLKIRLDNVGKRFNRGWVFQGVNCEIACGERVVILGSNGSGKSTLLRLISGSLTPSKGNLSFELNEVAISEEKIYKHVSLAAPYLELIQEYTLQEHISFHFKFKSPIGGLEPSKIPGMLHLNEESTKPIKQYSSGMLQRVKIGLSILSDTELLLLDEPATNLDAEAIQWYNELLNKYGEGRCIVICSNRREEEYQNCGQELIMENYRLNLSAVPDTEQNT